MRAWIEAAVDLGLAFVVVVRVAVIEVEVLAVVVADAFVLVVTVFVVTVLTVVLLVFLTARDACPLAVFRRLLGLASESNSLSSMSERAEESESGFGSESAFVGAVWYSRGSNFASAIRALRRLVSTISVLKTKL